MKRLLLAGLLAFGLAAPVSAAPLVAPCTEANQTASECDPVNTSNPLPTAPGASSSSSYGITPIVGGSAVSTLQLKNGAGNLYSVYANSSVSGYLMVFNTTTTPTNGSTTAGTASGNMVECVGPSTQPFISNLPGPPDVYSVGIYAAFSTTGCGTLTLSATAFIKGKVQ